MAISGLRPPKLESDHLLHFLASLFPIMEEQNSWLRRTKFSHTLYTRVDPGRVPIAPLSKDIERKLQKFATMGKSMSMPVDRDNEDTGTALKHSPSLPLVRSSLQLDSGKANKPKKASLEIPLSSLMNLGNFQGFEGKEPHQEPKFDIAPQLLEQGRDSFKPIKEPGEFKGSEGKEPGQEPKFDVAPELLEQDTLNPREAKSSSKRFASPPPERRGSEKSIYGKSFATQVSDLGQSPDWCSTPVLSGKHKSAKKYNGRRRVSAVDTTDDRRLHRVRMNQAVQTTVDWTLDPSKLLVGHRFASGAYSRLYRGLYDDNPVAIKFIRQPDDDDNGKLAAKLEKQYNSEINSLSHLYHKNVIKETVCDVLVEDEGTYRWMAPEMIKQKAYNRKVDVYSFGLLIWEMVSGRIPYENLTPFQVAYAVANRNLKPTIPPECPSALRPLIEQCCALQPDKRPDFWQIVKVLEQFQSVLSQGGCLDTLKSGTCQDHKKRLLHWIQKLKPSHGT
ncbi:hypothetical protein PR202_ga24094 [Eleusine coracana subsp. coracana]|uniref:Protein kinase domain-containing protein n=1 Tax=Eleusine coracana subsp. coracana TaxID=191504 RepID=A0AAV5D7M4_ELECO|nr:hypothetical protein PR202_ga24094 [Eleusine coracana subsp. coracana]